MVSFKQFVKEASFSIGGVRPGERRLSSAQPSVPTNYLQSTPSTVYSRPQRTKSPVTPSISPQSISSVPERLPMPDVTGKNGRLSPSELVKVGSYKAGPAGRAQWYGDDAYLSPKAAQAFIAAQQDFGAPIQINSAYRNIEHQRGLSGEGHRVVARAGTSRHGLGKALDLQPGTPGYSWMRTNGSRYGWIFKAISGDPYHFEYVG